jgi:hypothetical protein
MEGLAKTKSAGVYKGPLILRRCARSSPMASVGTDALLHRTNQFASGMCSWEAESNQSM